MATDLRFDVSALDRASAVFAKIATSVDRFGGKLDELDRQRVAPTVDLDDAKLATKIERAKQSLESLNRARANPRLDIDTAAAQRAVDRAQERLDQLSKETPSVELDIDIADAMARLDTAKLRLDSMAAKRPKIDVDIADAEIHLAQLLGDWNELQDKKLQLDVDTDGAQRNVGALASKLQRDIETAIAALPDIELDADSSAVDRRIQEIRTQLQDLADRRIGVDVDTGQAQAQIAALSAELIALGNSSPSVEVQVDTGAAAAALGAVSAEAAGATNALEGIVGMADAIAAAFPPATTAVIALPGALMLAAAPIAATQLGLDGIANSTARLLPGFATLRSEVSGTFELGLKPAISDINSLMPTLTEGLSGSASAVVDVASGVAKVAASKEGVAELDRTFENVNSTVSGMGPGLESLTSNFLRLSAEGSAGLSGLDEVVAEFGEQWDGVVDRLADSGRAREAVSTLVDGLGGLLSIIPPLVEAGVRLETTIGPPLAGALHIVGAAVSLLTGPLGAVTNIVLAGAAAWKIATVAVAASSAGLAALRGGLAAVATSYAALTGGATASATAQSASAASSVSAAAAAAANAATLAAQSTAAATAASAAEAHATAMAADAAAARTAATALAQTAVSEADVAAATEAANVATRAQVVASEAAAAALAAQARAANAAAVAAAANAEANATAGAAAGGAAGSTGRVASAMSRLGAALPIVGVALIGVAIAYDSLIPSASDAATAMLQGGDAATAAAEKLKEQNAQFREGSIFGNMFRVTQADITAEQEKQMATMGPVEAATARVHLAQTAWNNAVRDFPPNSQQARDAAGALATANQNLAKAQSDAKIASADLNVAVAAAATHFGPAGAAADAAARGAVTWAAALTKLSDPLSTASDKASAFTAAFADAADPAIQLAQAIQAENDAVRGLGEALDGVNPKLVQANGTINTTTEAGSNLQTAVLASASAFQGLYGATVAAEQGTKGVNVAQADGVVAMENARQKMLDQAIAAGINKTAAKAMVDQYLAIPDKVKTTITQPGMVSALADSMGLKASITAVPDDKSIIVSTLSDQAKQQLQDLGLQVKTLPNGQILISADGSPARDEIFSTVTFANGQTGTVTIDGNRAPVDGKTTAAVQFADGSKGVITLDGNPADARGQVSATVTYANGQTGTIKLTSRDAGAIATANFVADSISKIKATIQIVASQVPGKAVGDIVPAFAFGGIQRFASGGLSAAAAAAGFPGASPFRAGTAQVFPPNRLRVTGDRTANDEFYIPDDTAPRSLALLSELARRRGFDLVKHGQGDVALLAGANAAVGRGSARAAMLPSAMSGAPTRGVASIGQAVAAAIRAGLRDMAAGGGITEQQLGQMLTAIKSARPITVEDHSGNPVETARATSLALRR